MKILRGEGCQGRVVSWTSPISSVVVRLVVSVLLGIMVCAPFTSVAAQNDAIPVASAVASPSLVQGADKPGTGNTTVSPEQQLIEQYAPIMALKNQEALCDSNGEPFLPTTVEVALGDPTVQLKRKTGSSSASDEVVTSAPVARDLYARGSEYYLDFPGNPTRPGCSYEQWFKERSVDHVPTTYAHIVGNGSNLLVIQYWFYYTFNDFNNKHESDWEMMQILFEVGTVQEALNAEPIQVAIAQHGGGETSDWNAAKLRRDGTHPIIFASAGSHSTQYEDAVYLGWGENGTGFGCDTTTGPSTHVALTPVLLPTSEPDPASQFAWLNFEGRWGERREGEYNGPTGPAMKRQWTSPFLWQSQLRDSSMEVPLASTFGPAPTEVFCSLSSAGSALFTRVGESRPLLIGSALTIIAVVTGLLLFSRDILSQAFGVYRRRWGTFAQIGLVLIPVGILFNGFQYLIAILPPGKQVLSLMEHSPGSYFAQALLVGIVQHLVGLIVVGPAVIQTYKEMEKNQHLSPRAAYTEVVRTFRSIAEPVVKSSLILILLSLTVIGIPVAIWLLVKWLFIPQAVVLDGRVGKDARNASAEAVTGHWWVTAAKVVILTIIGAAPGVLIGLILLIFGSTSVQFTNVASSLIFAVFQPFSLLGMTILYRRHQGQKIRPLEYDEATAATLVNEVPAPA